MNRSSLYLLLRKRKYSTLSKAQSQLSSLPIARSLYLQAKKLVAAEEHSYYDNHLDTLSVRSKLKESVTLESGCRTWNRSLLGCNPGQLSFILCAASDTLPTSVNLKCWHIQCGARCSLRGCTQPATAHVLGGCPTSLKQGRFTYRHNQVLQCLTAELKKLRSTAGIVSVYTDLPGLRASGSPQATAPPTILVTSYGPDIVLVEVIK